MEIIKFQIQGSERCDIIPIGDMHIGNAGFDRKRLKDLVAWIKDRPNIYWIGMGDYIDAINIDDKRFDVKSVDSLYLSKLDNIVIYQINEATAMLKPIAGKCMGLIEGNHEKAVKMKYHIDPVAALAYNLNTKILGDCAAIRVRFAGNNRSRIFTIFAVHGNTGGRHGGGKINRLEDMLGFFDADIYLMAHAHIKALESRSQMGLDRLGNLIKKKKILAVTGSFLKGYAEGSRSYVEANNLPPTDIGVVKIMIDPSNNNMHGSI
jgi:hypothetical protein